METESLIEDLLAFAEAKLMLEPRDENVVRNDLMSILGTHDKGVRSDSGDATVDTLSQALVAATGVDAADADELCDKVFGAITASSSVIDERFKSLLKKNSKAATDWLYRYFIDNGYVKRSRLDKNPRFDSCGLVVTINKAKPEFRDPKKAAAQVGGYPKCVICRENEGCAPKNKRTLRTVSITLGGEDYFWQYSPFGYFNEHGIAVNCVHKPMCVEKATFGKLMDFVDLFPHYFIGCNAALPRIGGSVLAHDHYQGGGEILPLQTAPIKRYYKDAEHKKAVIGIVDWRGSVIRVIGNRDDVTAVCEKIRAYWVKYNNKALGIVSQDEAGEHNAVSPAVIKRNGKYEMTVILRSNITSDEYPDGVFHSHPEYHCIKKESVGLIEAQGLFILPGRLERELGEIKACVESGKPLPQELGAYRVIFDDIKRLYDGDADKAIKTALGNACNAILENTAVFKTDADFDAFMKGVGFTL